MDRRSPTQEAYDELQAAYDFFNRELFAGELPDCLITMQREKRTAGYFSPARFVNRHDASMTDEIAINPAYFAVQPLREVLQTLVHEMVHLWQSHFGTPSRACYHNGEWADKMEAVGLMPSCTGEPGGKRTGQKMADYTLPGGPFEVAASALVAGNAGISWLDRFPPMEAASAIPMIAAEGNSAAVASVLQPKEGGRSNRVKFRCPHCGAQAWGKPSLKILCGGNNCAAAPFVPCP
jgi:hypothetical protein